MLMLVPASELRSQLQVVKVDRGSLKKAAGLARAAPEQTQDRAAVEQAEALRTRAMSLQDHNPKLEQQLG